MDIDGTTALVTGGTSGLGLATARALAAEGARVVLTGRSPERAEKALAELGGAAVYVPGDITRPGDVAAAVGEAVRLGRFRVAVQCAGVAWTGRTLGRRGPLALEDFERVVRVNLIGTFNVVRLAAEAMAAAPGPADPGPSHEGDPGDRPAGEPAGDPTSAALPGERGVIICTSSIAAFDGQAGQAAYAASKAGIAGMTLPLARDLARHAVRVVTLAPGLFATPMIEGLRDDVLAALVERTPHPARLGRPEEFASLVAHTVRNPMLNGEVIRLDGAARLGFG